MKLNHNFSLNNTADLKGASKTFKKNNKVLINNILEVSGAEMLTECLTNIPDWNLIFNSESKHYDLSAKGFSELERQKQEEIKKSVFSSATRQFSYLYKNYPIFDLINSGKCDVFLKSFFEFLNSDGFIHNMRRITRNDYIDYADAQATCFDSGHFLTSHDDDVSGKKRIAAFVFNLSPNWHPDWGGNLSFYNKENKIEETFVPQFNTLSILKVGYQHAVSMVTPFSSGPRLAITGWLRSR